MKKKNKLFVLGTGVVTSMLTFALVGCNGPTAVSSFGGQSSSGGTTTSSGESISSGTDDQDGIFETKSIERDLEFDDENNPLFDDEIRIKVWSIIGDPDQVIFQKLVDQFNSEYLGQIHIDLVYQGHFDYYSALDTTWVNDFESFPDVCFMHNEKTVEYAYKGYLYPLDSLFDETKVTMDLSQIYSNIDRVTQYKNHRFALPVDAHGFVTQFRQDIIKKNGLGFDNNTRFIPNSRAEYSELLQKLREKADKGELLVRNINRSSNHAWKTANASAFYPEFTQSTDPDGLSALYANGGSLLNEAQDTVVFQNNKGFETYVTDQVDRWNNKLMGESGTAVEMFGTGSTVMFSEGPWWVSQTYSANWNNTELKTADASKGVSEEDASDPILNTPYTASRPTNWWTLDENASTENGTKWFGNGHAISVTRHCTSMQKVAAALTFMKWYTQEKTEATDTYHLTTWCSSGHIPAWKNVYDSADYKDLLEKNLTCRALGDPKDVIALEGLEYESTIVSVVADSCTNVINELKSSSGCTKERAVQIISEVAEGAQAMLDLLTEEF